MLDRPEVRGAVIGVGNALMTDDGIGEAVVVEFVRSWPTPGVRFINAGSDPLRVVQELEDLDFALVIDAAEMRLAPGAVRAFDADQVDVTVRLDGRSAHGVDLNAVVLLARRLGLAGKIRFVAVQPAVIGPGCGLSPALRARFPRVVARAARELARLVKVHRREKRRDPKGTPED